MANGRFAAPKKQKQFPVRKIALILGIAAAVLAVVIGGFFLIQTLTDPLDSRMAEGVSIGGLDVGGMKKSEAKSALTSALDETLLSQQLTVSLPDGALTFAPEALGFDVDVAAAIKDAYAIGRKTYPEDTALGLGQYLTMNDQPIRDALLEYALLHDTNLTEPSFAIEGAAPVLDTASFDSAAPGQTLSFTKGLPDYHLDQEAVYTLICEAFDSAIALVRSNSYEVTFDYEPEALPAELDIDGLYLTHSVAAVNDSLDMDTYQFVNGSYGYSFDLVEVKRSLTQAGYGETVTVTMEYQEPEILGDGVYFRDVLGTCETKHNTNENRNTNLRILCAALNGVIIQPGEEFSYNETLGERTAEKGYLPAPAYSGSRLVDSIGGGVCQGSSTLYNCVLLADLEVVTRLCHGATISYLPLGLDAAVNWGTTDFVFRNNWNFPVKIEAEVSDGYVKMKILGTDEKDYYIKMTSGYDDSHDGYITAVSYKNKYDKETDELISKDREAFSTYYTDIG